MYKLVGLILTSLLFIGCNNKQDVEQTKEKIEDSTPVLTKYFMCKDNKNNKAVRLEIGYSPNWGPQYQELHFFLQMKKYEVKECSVIKKVNNFSTEIRFNKFLENMGRKELFEIAKKEPIKHKKLIGKYTCLFEIFDLYPHTDSIEEYKNNLNEALLKHEIGCSKSK